MHLSMILPSCFLPTTKLISGSEHGLGIAAVHEAQVLGNGLVEDQAAHGGVHQLVADHAVPASLDGRPSSP